MTPPARRAGRGELVEQVPVELARWAVGPGLEVIAEATAALDAGEGELGIGTWLRERVEPPQAAFALTAAVARRRARDAGVEAADQLVLTREALEQASHPVVAAWRAARAAELRDGPDDVVVDLCAGTGADAVAFAASGPVVAVEGDPGRAVLAAHRASVLERPVEVVTGDALAQTERVAGRLAHADPDRRDASGRRARTLGDHRPAVDALAAATAGARGRLLTVAPGVAWDDPALPADADVAFVQHDRSLVEAVLRTGAARPPGSRATAVLLPSGRTWTRPDGDRHRAPVRAVGEWLVDPAPAVVRARLHDELAARLDGGRVARRRALLTTDVRPAPEEWYRAERVLAVLGARPRDLRAHLRATGEERPLELVLHGVQVDVRRWLRDAGSPATGPAGLRAHVVRRDDDAVTVLTDGAMSLIDEA